MKKYLIGFLGVMAWAAPVMASVEWPVRPGADWIYLGSPGYHKFLDDAYDGVTGGIGWVGADVGALVRLTDRFSLQPKMEGYFNVLRVTENGEEFTKANAMGFPALGLKASLFRTGIVEFDLNGEVGAPFISMSLPGVRASGDGVGYGVSGSVRLWRSMDIQLGYKDIPIEITPRDPLVTTKLATAHTYNFGGVFLSVGYYF
jgi:hypothetical protein